MPRKSTTLSQKSDYLGELAILELEGNFCCQRMA